MKRSMDLILSFTLVTLFLPIFIIVAVLVRCFLGSPVLFKQKRPGKDKVPFHIYKFRTMTDERGSDGQLLPDDKRLTWLGKWLRKLSLDELPQLINVLKGEMSLVGPRPLLMDYLPYYTHRENKRFLVRPGITGLAQISGRNQLNWDDRLELDAHYVDHQSIWLDIKIVILTILKVLKQENTAVISQVYVEDLDKQRMGMGK